MGWGKLDDGFDDHPKVLALLDEEDLATAGVAIGLWTLCLSWANRNTRKKGKTPGLLQPSMPRRYFGPLGKSAAQMLVKHRLWEPQDDGGWMIHDFQDYLPTDETRAARSAAGRRGAASRWANRDGNLPSRSHGVDGKPMASDGNGGAAPSGAPDDHPGVPRDGNEPSGDGKLPSGSHACDGKPMATVRAISKEIAPLPEPPPPPEEKFKTLPAADASRNVITETIPGLDNEATQATTKPASAKPRWTEPVLAALFDRFYKPFPRKKDPKAARVVFDRVVREGADPERIIAGSERYAQERDGRDPQYTKHPKTWLNAGGWLSEADPPDPAQVVAEAQERRSALERTVQEIRRTHPPCIHGEPGGATPHPTGGFLLCPSCRRGAPAVIDPDRPGTDPDVAAAVTSYRSAALRAGRCVETLELVQVTGQAINLLARGAAADALAAVAGVAGRDGSSLVETAMNCARNRGEAA